MKPIDKVTSKIPQEFQPLIQRVLTINDELELDRTQILVDGVFERTSIKVEPDDVWLRLYSHLRQYQRQLKLKIDFIINYQRAVILGVPTDHFNFDF